MSSNYSDDQREEHRDIDPSNWISQAEAARRRGVSRQAIYDLVQRGRLRALEVGGRTLVNEEDVKDFSPEKGGRPPKRKDN